MGLILNTEYGQTALSPEEKEGILIKTVSTRADLDEFEQDNIEDAMLWLFSRNFKAEKICTESFIKNLHKRMYKNVWAWAGDFRKTNKNLGVDKWQIGIELKMLCDNALFWVEHNTYPADELAIRFKHKIVSIHCFSNGNGRHSRLMADVIVEKIFQLEPFSWGAKANLANSRELYLKALHEADKGSFSKLIAFARS